MFAGRTVILVCGASRLALGVFVRRGGHLRLTDFITQELAAPRESADTWLSRTGAAMAALGRRKSFRGPVVLVLPAQLILVKLLRLPRADPALRDPLFRFEAEQNIPYALADVAWEIVVTGEAEAQLDCLLVACRLDVLEPLCQAAASAGFEPGRILPEPLAILAAFRLGHPSGPEPVLLLHLSGRFATLLLVASSRFAVRVFPLPGLALPPAGAEIVPGRLLAEITRSLLHFRERTGMAAPGRVYLAGEQARHAGLGEYLAAHLGIPVECLEIRGLTDFPHPAGPAGETGIANEIPGLAGAAALQLPGRETAVNLLPPSRRQRVDRQARQWRVLAAAVLATGWLLPPIIHFHRVGNEAQKKAAAIEREIAPLRERERRYQAGWIQLDEMGKQITRLQGLVSRRGSWAALLAGLQDRLGGVGDVWLEKLQVVPGAAGTPVRLAVSGSMLDRANPLAQVSPETSSRVQELLAGLGQAPHVVAVEREQFDHSRPGILQFAFVLVTDGQQPL